VRIITPLVITLLFCAMHIQAEDKSYKASTLAYQPYQYIVDGQPAGIAVDIINEAFSRAGAGVVEYSFFPWKRAVFLTETGQSDLLFNAGKNSERQQWGRYVNSVLIQQSYRLFKLASKDLKIEHDFRNVSDTSIAVRAGYLYGSGAFRNALDQGAFNDVLLSDSTQQSVNQLLHGRVDMFVGDYVPVSYYLRQLGLNHLVDTVEIEGEPLEVLSWPTYILLSRQNTDEELEARLFQVMEEMKQDGTYQLIVNRYRE